jgi:hypothetical protein
MEYPKQTIDFVIDTYKKVCDNKRANTLFKDSLNLYAKGLMPAWNWALTSAERAANEIGVHKFVGHFVFTLCVTKHIKDLYEQKGMPEGCFYGFLNDIKIKWAECVNIHKMDGVFVAEWFNRFVDGTRHTFGRLQFEPLFTGAHHQVAGHTINEGDLAIAIHIPSGSKLLKEDCIDSFLKAAEFYAPLFEDETVLFQCNSWLLYPGHKEFLPETSNILMFADFFTVVSSRESRNDLWRIFGQENCDDIASLPENSSLQRVYKKRLLENGEVGAAKGYFFVKGKEFIK